MSNIPKEAIEKFIPLAVEIVDLTIDMLSADARRSYMEQAIAKLIAAKYKEVSNER
jgi:hypothetical protein